MQSSMSLSKYVLRLFFTILLAAACVFAQAQPTAHSNASDPGPRGGPPGAGGTYPVLDNTNPGANTAYLNYFAQALVRFQEIDSVSGTIEGGTGLGPGFNHNSCGGCHASPAMGGSSPAVNPQVANNFAHLDGAFNPADTSKFLRLNGPVREVRFVLNSDGSLDGGVHDIFTIAGRTDAPGCNLQQPNFDQAIANGNAIFRIPTPLFGLGLVEMTSDETLQLNLSATQSQRNSMGIAGRFNTSGNDGTITRFGWKAQNKSLLIFAGEAYNVEQGVTNELFASDRFPAGTPPSVIANCTFNGAPEDSTNAMNGESDTVGGGSNPNYGTPIGTASEMSSDVVNFASFARLLAPASPTTASTSELNGQKLFASIGCALCHSPTLTTQTGRGGTRGAYPALQGMTYHPYSDFAIHHMGSNLADGINQGAAGPDEFRTAPLWGLGQRQYFLHDGRTSDLMQAIAAHASPGNVCEATQSAEQFNVNGQSDRPSAANRTCGSEANQVIQIFNGLGSSRQQDLLNFLRSL